MAELTEKLREEIVWELKEKATPQVDGKIHVLFDSWEELEAIGEVLTNQ